MRLNEEYKENNERIYPKRKMEMYNNIRKITNYFNNLRTNNEYLGKKREIENQNNYDKNNQGYNL